MKYLTSLLIWENQLQKSCVIERRRHETHSQHNSWLLMTFYNSLLRETPDWTAWAVPILPNHRIYCPLSHSAELRYSADPLRAENASRDHHDGPPPLCPWPWPKGTCHPSTIYSQGKHKMPAGTFPLGSLKPKVQFSYSLNLTAHISYETVTVVPWLWFVFFCKCPLRVAGRDNGKRAAFFLHGLLSVPQTSTCRPSRQHLEALIRKVIEESSHVLLQF